MGISCFERSAPAGLEQSCGSRGTQCLGHVRTSAPGGSAGLGQRPGRGEPQLRAVQKSAKRVLNPGGFLLMAKSERDFREEGGPIEVPRVEFTFRRDLWFLTDGHARAGRVPPRRWGGGPAARAAPAATRIAARGQGRSRGSDPRGPGSFSPRPGPLAPAEAALKAPRPGRPDPSEPLGRAGARRPLTKAERPLHVCAAPPALRAAVPAPLSPLPALRSGPH